MRRRGQHRLPLAASLSAGSEAQREGVEKILAGRSSEAEVIAALEGRLLADRVCPLCKRPATLWPCERNASGLFCDQDRYGPSGRNRRGRRSLCPGKPQGIAGLEKCRCGDPDAEEPERKPRKRGGKATRRGLSSEQVPILVAADRTGATISAILPAANTDTIKDVLAPVLGKDALLVTDGASFYPPCAAKLSVTHEMLNQSAGERVRGELHIQTVNSRHERLKTFLRRYIAASLPNTSPATSSGSISPDSTSTRHPARA